MNTPMEVPDLFKWATPCSLIFFIYVVCMVITAVVSVLFQHHLVFSFSLLHKYSCDLCSLAWPWGHLCKPLKANYLFPAAPQTQLHANFIGVAGPVTSRGEAAAAPCPQVPPVARYSQRTFPHTIIQCTRTHDRKAAQTGHSTHASANSTNGLIQAPSLADQDDSL